MFDDLADAQTLEALGDREYKDRLRKLEAAVSRAADASGEPDADPLIRQLCAWVSGHQDWNVRRIAVQSLADRLVCSQLAREAISQATHDDVDWVAFTAIKTAGKHRIPEAVEHLIRISGWPSNFSRPAYARKPVGCGAAFTKRALWDFFASRDPEELRRLEDQHFADKHAAVAAARREPALGDVVLVPAGPFIAGARRAARTDNDGLAGAPGGACRRSTRGSQPLRGPQHGR